MTRTVLISGNAPNSLMYAAQQRGLRLVPTVDSREAKFFDARAQRAIELSHFVPTSSRVMGPPSKTSFLEIYEHIASDPSLYHILSRTQGRLRRSSSFSQLDMISRGIGWASSILDDHSPEYFLCGVTPHKPMQYIFSRALELLGVPVFRTTEVGIPGRVGIFKGIDCGRFIPLIDPILDCKEREEVTDWIGRLSSSYAHAVPDYERERAVRHGSSRSTILGDFKTLIRSKSQVELVGRLMAIPEKRRAESLYWSLARRVGDESSRGAPRVVVFLHYQPERTTIPEAGMLADQLALVQSLALCCAQGCDIVVREHPSTFLNHFNSRFRSPHFYRHLSAIEHVSLASLDDNPFALVDSSDIVVTLRGTVASEALVRGKRVLVSRSSVLSLAPNAFPLEDVLAGRISLRDVLDAPLAARSSVCEFLVSLAQQCLRRSELDFGLLLDSIEGHGLA